MPALITHEGRQSGIQLQVTPLGARTLLGLPAGQLAGLDLEADDLLGPFAAELRDRVRAAGTWADRFAVLDDLLSRRASVQQALPAGALGPPRPEVAYAWRALLASRGAVPIADLARETGGPAATSARGSGMNSASRPRPRPGSCALTVLAGSCSAASRPAGCPRWPIWPPWAATTTRLT